MRIVVLMIICILGALVVDAAADEYFKLDRNGTKYRIYIAEPKKIELYWKNPHDGQAFKRFSEVQKHLETNGHKVVFMMNGGIYEPGGVPAGLHIENGKETKPLNLSVGDGNFFLLPNGVFMVTKSGKAVILETHEFAEISESLNVRIALQSGPLLMRKGEIHPRFSETSKNSKHRNGVGIDRRGRVVFAITETEQEKYPNFYEFTSLFKELDCEDALFLDGNISEMLIRPTGEIQDRNDFGCIVAISEKQK